MLARRDPHILATLAIRGGGATLGERDEGDVLEAVWLAFRTEFRRRWRSWPAIDLLVNIVGAVVLVAAATGRRTESAIGGPHGAVP